MLSKEQLLALAGDKKIVTVNVPGVGDVGIRILTGLEREAWEAQAFEDGKVKLGDHFRAKLLSKALCDENGKRLFTDNDIASISALPFPAIMRLFDEAMKINAITPDDVEDLAKN